MLIPVSITSHSVEKGKQIKSAGSADKYFDPCGSHLVDVSQHRKSFERSHIQLIDSYFLQLTMALHQLQHWIDDYVSITFFSNL